MSLEHSPAREGANAFTITQFCQRNHLSKPTYFELRRRGLGPREIRILNIVRISAQAEADWVFAREHPAGDEALAIAQKAEERAESARRAARKAVGSPLHVSNKNAGKRDPTRNSWP
jgi:hypothetical protein